MRVLLSFALLAVSLLLYAPRLSAPFIFDDKFVIVGNAAIRSLNPLEAFAARPGLSTAGRPLVGYSFALNYAVSGLRPAGYHALNLALHVACSWLVFLCLARLFAAPRNSERLRARADPLAAIAALLFAVHPLAVEVVLYTTQRTEAAASLFFLLTCYAFLREAGGERGHANVALAGVSACASALCKETIVAIFPLLLLCDRAYFSGSFAQSLRSRRALYAALLCGYVPLIALQLTSPRGSTVGFGDPAYLLAQGRYVFRYVTSAFWPQLALDPGEYFPSLAAGAFPYAVAVGLMVLATAVLLRVQPRLGFVGAWVFALLAPTSSFIVIKTEVAADRRAYLPLVALLGAAVVLADIGWSRLTRARSWSPRLQRVLVLVGVACVTSVFFVQSALRTDAFVSEVAFWEQALLDTPRNRRAAQNLGDAYQAQGRHDEAIKAYELALNLSPDYVDAHTNLGAVLLQVGRDVEGLAHLRTAIALGGSSGAHYNYGLAMLRAGRVGEARSAFEQALAMQPNYPEAHINLGMLLMTQGDTAGGLAHLARGVALRPEPRALQNYAVALSQVGRLDEARRVLERLPKPN